MGQRAGKRAVRSAEMQRKALDLRIGGASYEQIGRALDVSLTAAWNHVNKALTQTREKVAEDVEKVRVVEVRRLDAILVSLWPMKSDPRTADTILRAMDRRARLLGLDAPQKSTLEVVKGMTDEQLIVEAAAIVDRVRARADDPGGVETPADGDGSD